MPTVILTRKFFNITHDNESYAMVVVGISRVLVQPGEWLLLDQSGLEVSMVIIFKSRVGFSFQS